MFAFADNEIDDNEDKDEVLEVGIGEKRPASMAFNFQQEDDEEEDEDIVPQQTVHEQSIDYVEARQAVEEDPWDCVSWMKIVEEARSGRSGTLTLIEACELFLKQFPKSSSIWYLYCDTLLQQRDTTKTEEILRKCSTAAHNCRSVALWRLYLQSLKGTLDKMARHHDSYPAERRGVERAFEQALDSVGLCLDSAQIWRMYIGFVRDAHDLKAEDPGRKLAALRRIFQRCIVLPTDGVDEFYSEYVALERGKSEDLAERLMAEYAPRNAQARTVYKEKKRMLDRMDLAKLARVPGGAGNLGELEQLDAWAKYLRYERNMEGRFGFAAAPLLPEECALRDKEEEKASFNKLVADKAVSHHRELVTLAFEQCLCHFRHYPEVWLAYARFVWDGQREAQSAGGASSVLVVRAIYREGISILPYCALLRVAWAELEEEHGNVEIARDILKQCYESVPGALSFSALQRFVRKKDGKSAARKCFSETLPLRLVGKLDAPAYLCHAELELNVNADPETALNILALAAKVPLSDATSCPGGIECDISYVRLLSRVLIQLGDIERLRYAYHVALAALGNVAQQQPNQGQGQGRSSAAVGADAGDGLPSSGGGAVVTLGANLPAVFTVASNDKVLRAQWLLWEEFHCLENAFGSSDLLRLNRVRESRTAARNAFVDRCGSSEVAGITSTQVGGNIRYMGFNLAGSLTELLGPAGDRGYTMFAPTVLLFERYDNFSFPLVPAPPPGVADPESSPAHADYFLKLRSRGPAYVDQLMRKDQERRAAAAAGMGAGMGMGDASRRARGGRQSAEEIAASDELLGVPAAVRELLNRLPGGHANVSAVDIDGFVDHLRRAVLPPRPYSDMGAEESGVGMGAGTARPQLVAAGGGGGLFNNMDVEEEEDEDEGEGTASLAGPNVQYAEGLQPTVDIFRQRQRQRLGLDN